MDRLEAYLDSRMDEWTGREREAVRIAGLLVALLLFADDIALVARSLSILQRLVDALGVFCSTQAMTVNLGKTCWLLGGAVPRKRPREGLLYLGEAVQ